ncbi:MAG: hypothetical protein WCF97_03590, partial [Nitrososphaeraceae archaeon]
MSYVLQMYLFSTDNIRLASCSALHRFLGTGTVELQITSPLKVSSIPRGLLDRNCTVITTFCPHTPVSEIGLNRGGLH